MLKCLYYSVKNDARQSDCQANSWQSDCLASFLTGSTRFRLAALSNGQLSAMQYVLFGVPQGSVLGPSLYILYTAELSHIVAGHGLSLQQYADDCQVHISTTDDDASAAVNQLSTCLVDVEAWLKESRLRLNPTKTQLMWLGSQQLLARLDMAAVPVVIWAW